jgi:hypothetical protein
MRPSPSRRFALRRKLLAGLTLLAAGAWRLPAMAQTPRPIMILLSDGKASGPELTMPPRGAPVLRLVQGEAVELRIASDRATVLHLHGYRIETRAEPGAPAVMAFTARAAGRFAVETHAANGRHVALFYLEVYPR